MKIWCVTFYNNEMIQFYSQRYVHLNYFWAIVEYIRLFYFIVLSVFDDEGLRLQLLISVDLYYSEFSFSSSKVLLLFSSVWKLLYRKYCGR